MKTSLVMFVFLVAFVASADEKPTVAQCHANYEAWHQQVLSDATLKLEFDTLDSRNDDLLYCIMLDPDKTWRPKYTDLGWAYATEMSTRLHNYLSRHKLTNAFVQEDRDPKYH